MEKRKKLLCGIGGALLMSVAFLTGHYAGAASKTPGSTGDPLITLSYLEGRLAQTGGYTDKVQLERGQKLLGKQGTGIIVLGGSVTAAGNDLVDLTAGNLTEKETSLFLYHNYIAIEDNSGCEALSSCTVLVFGKYVIE